MSRDFQLPGRSPAYGTNGMVATSHPLASEVAIMVLRRGGNAVDAAVTASGVQAVVEPAMTGIGGDCFAIYGEAGKPLVAINGAGRSPAGIDPQWFFDKGLEEVPEESPHAVTIPGAVDCWQRLLDDHGTISLGEALQPAVRLAKEGSPVTPRVAYDWAAFADNLAAHEGSKDIYFKDGKVPQTGQIMRYPALAKTLEKIAASGPKGFYEGPVADSMVKHLRALGGAHTMDDFSGVAAEYVDPVTVDYRGLKIAEIPPSTHGVTAQLILKILEQFDLGKLDPNSAERFHLELEAARSAYRFRDAFVADPSHMAVSFDDLVSDDLARKLAGYIDRAKRSDDLGPVEIPKGSDTVYLTVVDSKWNAVSFINSVYHAFGSRITDPDTGVLFHSRGNCFNVIEDHPNCVGPSKKPMHTIIPAMAMKDDRVEISFGVMGAAYQPIGQSHFVTNVHDFGMNVQAAIDHPRIFWQGEAVGYERGVPEATRAGLAERGHELAEIPSPLGGGQAIKLDWEEGVLVGGSDPRKDGTAIGF